MVRESGCPDRSAGQEADPVTLVGNVLSGVSTGVVIQTGVVSGGLVVNNRAAAAPPVALRQIPPRVFGFAGREDDLRVLAGLLDPCAPPSTPSVAVITGLAGVGKTTLCVHAAHDAEEAGRFPGGVLFIDLHGYEDSPVRPHQALDSLLRALGVPGKDIPPGLDARAGLFRSLLVMSDGPVLVIVDNAAEAAQVVPLLPGERRHRVVITSRHTLRLDARIHELRVPSRQAALELLDRALRTADSSDRRATSEPESAARVAECCGRLPLALQIAAALLIADPGKSVSELASELADSSDRLPQLSDGERAVRTAFDLSYRRLPQPEAALFRALALHPGPDFATGAAVALSGEPPRAVGRMLGELLRAHVVQRATGPGRWGMHDLLGEYARSLVEQDAEDERLRRSERLLDHYLHIARAAARLHSVRSPAVRAAELGASDGRPAADESGFRTLEEALAWFRAERVNLQSCVTWSATMGDAVRAAGIAHATAEFLMTAGYWEEAVDTHRAAVVVSRTAGDMGGEATALTDLGAVQQLTGDPVAAIANLTEAVGLCRRLGNRLGEALALAELGGAQRLAGRYSEAIRTLTDCLDLYTGFDSPAERAACLCNLGAVRRLTGQLLAAHDTLVEALNLYLGVCDLRGAARVLTLLGAVRREMGDYRQATGDLLEALRLCGEIDDRFGRATALSNLGAVRWLDGDSAGAVVELTEALRLHREVGSRAGEAHVLTFLGAVQSQCGDFLAAEATLDRALAFYRELGDRGGEVEALSHRAVLHTLTGCASTALELHLRALDLAREIRSRWDEANALRGLAMATRGVRGKAVAYLRSALDLYRSMGCAADSAWVEGELAALLAEGEDGAGRSGDDHGPSDGEILGQPRAG
ncbi:ATP-binding protein [Kitasatospora purpeofusca]|uniref:ATP-binding protein n=1 Tax=Kitasatospora purpeofusca TaxID=67352 RepID=UPI0036EFE4D4